MVVGVMLCLWSLSSRLLLPGKVLGGDLLLRLMPAFCPGRLSVSVITGVVAVGGLSGSRCGPSTGTGSCAAGCSSHDDEGKVEVGVSSPIPGAPNVGDGPYGVLLYVRFEHWGLNTPPRYPSVSLVTELTEKQSMANKRRST